MPTNCDEDPLETAAQEAVGTTQGIEIAVWVGVDHGGTVQEKRRC